MTKHEVIISNTEEIYIEDGDFTIIANPWANGSGVNIFAHGKHLTHRLSGALTWTEVEHLVAALTAAYGNGDDNS